MPESVVPVVFGFGEEIPPSGHASNEVSSSRAKGAGLTEVCSAFEEVRRLHFAVSFGTGFPNLASHLPYRAFLLQAFDSLRSEILCHGARLQKALDKGRSLRLLCEEKEVELTHWRYEAYRSSNYESYLMEQVISRGMGFSF